MVPPLEAAQYGATSWVALNEPSLPVVAYVDMNQGVPTLENLWAVLKQTKGALLAYITGGATTMVAMMQTEMLLLRSMPEEACHVRCFVRVAKAGGDEGCVGWANLMFFPSSDSPELRTRMGSSISEVFVRAFCCSVLVAEH